MDNKKATLELGTKPVGQLLMQYALPAIVAMTASSLYNMIDSIFIGQGCGPLAISGLAITFPLMNLMAAFGAAVGVGASTCISVKLGQKDYDTALHIFGNNFSLNLFIGIVFSIVSLLSLNPILYFFGASEHTLPYAREYMLVILGGNTIQQLYFGMNAVLRAASKPRQAMLATIFTVVLNVILAPLFIWGFDMGIAGAAWATIIAQAVALVWQCWIFSDKDGVLHFKRGTYKFDRQIVRNILAIGMSPFAMNVCACIVVIFINTGLARYGGDMAVGAYGIANKVAFTVVMIVMGLNQGLLPIAGYNYGAQKYDRLLRALNYAVLAGTAITTAGFIVGVAFPYECARLFTTDPELISISMRAIRINMLVFPIVGFQMVTTAFFQSIGKAKISIFLSLSRQMLFLLPMLIALPLFFGVDGIWYALPLSDLIAAVVAAVMIVIYIRKFKKQYKAQTYEQR